MGLITKLLGGGVLSGIKGIIGQFKMDPADKAKLEMALIERENLFELSLQQELKSREKVLVAELTQGDTYTKRARPTVVYFGLIMVLFNAIMQAFGKEMLKFPEEFWYGWAGIVATYSIGRSMEKRRPTKVASILD